MSSPTSLIQQSFSFQDIATLLGVMLLTWLSVRWGHIRHVRSLTQIEKNSKPTLLDYLLMGRQLSLPLFIATLVASWYGGILGVTQIAFEQGIYNFISQGVVWYGVYFVFAFVLIKKIRAGQPQSLSDMVEKRFGKKAGKWTSLVSFVAVLPAPYLLSLGIVIHLFSGWSVPISCAVSLLIIFSYITTGGLRSIVYSDLIQFFVMCSAVAMVAFFSWQHFGGLEFLKNNLPASHFKISGQTQWLSILAWFLVAASTWVNPCFYQRCLAARSPQTASWGIYIAVGIWCLFDICTTLGGMYARAVFPDAAPETAFLTYITHVLPSGLRGWALAGVIVTVLSALDSFLFIAASILSLDLLRPRLSSLNNASVRPVHRSAIFIVGALAFILAVLPGQKIELLWLRIGGFFSGTLLIPLLYGWWVPRRPGSVYSSDEKIFLTSSMGAGIIMLAFWFFQSRGYFLEIDAVVVGCLASFSILGGFWFIPCVAKRSELSE